MSACDGGAGFTGAAGQPPGSTPDPLGLNAVNARQAASVAFGSTLKSIGTGQLIGGSAIASSPSNEFQKPQLQRSMSGLLARAAPKLPGGPATAPIGPFTEPCLVDGMLDISGDLATGLPYSVGDTINVDATDCDDGFGEVVNGRMEITVTAYSGDILFGPTYLIEMSVLLIDYEVATAADTIVTNGDATVLFDTTGDPLITMSISGSSLNTTSLGSSETISNFLTSQTVDISISPEPYTLAASGTVASSLLAGSISYTTTVTFQGAGANDPFAGEMLVTGANGGAVKLIALDEINVRIMTDADGDGTFESTEDTTWADITS